MKPRRNVFAGALRIAVAVSLFAFVACDDDDGMAPSDVDVSGTWTYAAEGLTGGGLTCSFTAVQATITQTGASFTGSTQGGSWLCQSALGSLGDDLDPQTVAAGTVAGNDVSFRIDGLLTMEHVGTVSGNTMSGTVTATGTVEPAGAVSLAGSWTATR